ncbi:MAG: hypothetical protein AAF959_03540 [Cyanobacteria bacterium P01_D01_bin.56]
MNFRLSFVDGRQNLTSGTDEPTAPISVRKNNRNLTLIYEELVKSAHQSLNLPIEILLKLWVHGDDGASQKIEL